MYNNTLKDSSSTIQNKPKTETTQKIKFEKDSNNIPIKSKKLSHKKKKKNDYNHILNRYKLPSERKNIKKDNSRLSIGTKKTIKINVL